MLLSRDSILKHLQNGTIVIDPFDDRKLKTTSYDVSLGEWYWRENHPSGRASVHNLYDEESTKMVWSGPFRAEPAMPWIRLKNPSMIISTNACNLDGLP